MRIVFFGTPEYILPILEKLHRSFKSKIGKSPIVAVVTQKPKPVGRKQLLEYSAVDSWAYQKKLPIFFEPRDLIKNKIEADLGILAAFGRIIPPEVIKYFPLGILNIHPSLLPQYRGASPIQAALVNGDTETGVTIIKLDEKLDHGPVVAQFKEEILATDTTEGLRKRLFERAAEVLIKLIPAYLDKKIRTRPQNEDQATFTKLLKKEDGFIDFSKVKPEQAERLVRAMTPWPGAWTTVRIKNKELRIKILKAHLEDTRLILDKVQLEGKNPVSWEEFKKGYPNLTF